jgi:diamine N-acetyltransferase
MEFKIRLATIDDLKAIQGLNLMLFKKEYAEFDDTLNCNWTFGKDGEEYFTKCITEDDGCVFVACINDKIIGYLAGGLVDKIEPYRVPLKSTELENMFVIDKYRDKGIGSQLYQAFVGWSKSKGANRLRVSACAQNLEGINFYRKNGFIDYGFVLETNI